MRDKFNPLLYAKLNLSKNHRKHRVTLNLTNQSNLITAKTQWSGKIKIFLSSVITPNTYKWKFQPTTYTLRTDEMHNKKTILTRKRDEGKCKSYT